MDIQMLYQDRIYLPSRNSGVDTKEYLLRYTEREFPEPDDDSSAIYSVPRAFRKTGEKQASLAEQVVFARLHGLGQASRVRGLWLVFFHSASYAGHSFRNHRDGKLMIREHDFVIFAKHYGKYYVVLAEVKSSHDVNTDINGVDITSDAKVIKNNKRSAQHQLRDHLEVLHKILDLPEDKNAFQSYIMWPFLSARTKDPKHAVITRWKDDGNLHVFEHVLSDQEYFNQWFVDNVASPYGIEEKHFIALLNRYIILSCGVFVDEITNGMLALCNQEQLELIRSEACHEQNGKPLVIHGAAGTGKTLLVLKKLEQLHASGQLDECNRALYICYWPGIRCDVQNRLEMLGIDKYVDTARFYISQSGFLLLNRTNYKHIFMDEAEALCLAFDSSIMTKTLATIFQRYHDGNCELADCTESNLSSPTKKCHSRKWGELWFLVDINQASMFLPKHSPQLLKTPSVVLRKVMRSTGYIFNIFKQFYSNPMPLFPELMLLNMNIPDITLGHHILGPPIYWIDTEAELSNGYVEGDKSLHAVVTVVIDLCATKGFKPNDLCVIPALITQKFLPDNVNTRIDEYFVGNGYRPRGVNEIESFLSNKEVNDFLISWVLKTKGVEFKVVIMVIDDEDYDINDFEDRKKTYIMASRCTSMLILVSTKTVKDGIDLYNVIEPYPFSLSF